MIDLDVMPPDWKFAENHAKAVKPGIAESLESKKGNNVFCQCCLKPVEKESVPLTSNSKELEFLGFGFPLYFITLKYAIILVLLLICSYSGVSLYWSIVANSSFCSHRLLAGSGSGDPHCTSFLILFSRIEHHVEGEEIILRIASFVVHLFALIYIRDNIRKTYEYYDEKTTSLSDFSLMIKKLPLKDGIQKNIKDFINEGFKKDWEKFEEEYHSEHFKVEAEKIKQIILIPDLDEYFKLEGEKKALIEEKRKILIEEDKGYKSKTVQEPTSLTNFETPLEKIDEKIKQAKQKIENVKKEYRYKASQDKLHAEMAIVVLNTEMFKNVIKDFGEDSGNKLDKTLLGKYFGDFEGEIEIEETPEPNEIIWQNLHYSSQDRFVGKLIGWSLSVLFIAVVTVIFYFILVGKTNIFLHALESDLTLDELHKSGSYKAAVFLVFLLIFLIVLFNKLILGTVLHYFTHLEKHEHTSDDEFSFCLKYTLGLFFTTALMTLAVEAITFHNFYAHEYGVIEEESIMFFVNAFFIPLFMLVNPFQLKKLIMKRFKVGKKYYTQAEANYIMSDNQYTMGKEYAEIVETLWFTFLYATMIPLGAFITVIGLALYYWMSKYNVLRRSSLSHNISGEMSLFSLKLIDFTLIMKPIGEMIFDSGMRDDGVGVESIVLVCVAFVYLIIPIDRILEFFHEEEFRQEESTYDQVKHTFLETYETLHPIMNHEINTVFKNVQSKTLKKISLTQIELPELINDIIEQNVHTNPIQSKLSIDLGMSQNSILFNQTKQGVLNSPEKHHKEVIESENDMNGSRQDLLLEKVKVNVKGKETEEV